MVRIEHKVAEYIERIVVILLVTFGIFVAYQLIRLIFGGSWAVEDIIISLLVFNIGAVFTIGLMLASLSSDHKHLAGKFNHLANDFKEHVKKHK